MNRNYRSYCRRMGEAMSLRHIFPRSALSDDEILRLYQTAQTTDLDVLRQTAAELFPERFQNEQSSEESAQNECHKISGGMVCPY